MIEMIIVIRLLKLKVSLDEETEIYCHDFFVLHKKRAQADVMWRRQIL
jgi:hypothetical protein